MFQQIIDDEKAFISIEMRNYTDSDPQEIIEWTYYSVQKKFSFLSLNRKIALCLAIFTIMNIILNKIQ